MLKEGRVARPSLRCIVLSCAAWMTLFTRDTSFIDYSQLYSFLCSHVVFVFCGYWFVQNEISTVTIFAPVEEKVVGKEVRCGSPGNHTLRGRQMMMFASPTQSLSAARRSCMTASRIHFVHDNYYLQGCQAPTLASMFVVLPTLCPLSLPRDVVQGSVVVPRAAASPPDMTCTCVWW